MHVFLLSRRIIDRSSQTKLNCTSREQIFYLVDAQPPKFEWIIDEDFGKIFDFNQYISYTLRTKELYHYSKLECDFQMTTVKEGSYCYLNFITRPETQMIHFQSMGEEVRGGDGNYYVIKTKN